MGTVRCGNCGSLVELPETSSFGMGFNISKESIGDYVLKMEKETQTVKEIFNNTTATNTNVKENKAMTKQEQMIELLKANGFNVDDFFSAIGTNTVAKETVEDDPIATQIVNDGDVFNGRLDGRWIMAQMFHMLDYNTRRGRGYNDALNNKGYIYQWDFLLGRDHGKDCGELLRLVKRTRDKEDMTIKSIWFNGRLVSAMITDYCDKLKKYIDSIPTYMCKNKLPYKRLGKKYEHLTQKPNGDIFVDDLPHIYRLYADYARKAAWCNDYTVLCKIVKDFRKDMIFPSNSNNAKKYFKMSEAFKDAYKGNGAYYTAANLIRFHKCVVRGCDGKADSMVVLDSRAKEGCGWKLLGFLKELISDNDFKIRQY